MSQENYFTKQADPQIIWRPSLVLITLFILTMIVLPLPFSDGLSYMWNWWFDRPEYSHGILMPVIAGFLLWQQRDKFELHPFNGSWAGVGLVLLGSIVLLIAKLGAVQVLIQYSYVVTLCGLMLAMTGSRFTRMMLVSWVILFLMVPLPEFLLKNLTAELQLLSSKLGVAVIRLFGVSVYLEGNVIDLGVYKLEVAEACSGLRYLFPLMTLSFIMAHFFKAPLWKRVVVFLSSIPVTIVMNSLRIGAIGVMVDRWGQAMAEGFLHDFEGWAMFMVSTAVLIVEIVVLNRVGGDSRPWREVFGVEFPPPPPKNATRRQWQPTLPFIVSVVMVALLALSGWMLPERHEAVPSRAGLAEFPTQIDGWTGRRSSIEAVYLDTLKLDDYLMADYTDGVHAANLYVAWYDSQQAGRSTHSPRTCIPGGGWRITSFTQKNLSQIKAGGVPLRVNRAVIENGEQKQLVYYWFQQRGRVITNEYAAKWFLFWDSLTRNRTDGALVRLIMPVPAGQTAEAVESRLIDFTTTVVAKLDAYVPR